MATLQSSSMAHSVIQKPTGKRSAGLVVAHAMILEQDLGPAISRMKDMQTRAETRVDDIETGHDSPSAITDELMIKRSPSSAKPGIVNMLRTRFENLPSAISQLSRSIPPMEDVMTLVRTTTVRAVIEVNKLGRSGSQYVGSLTAHYSTERQQLRHARSQYVGPRSVSDSAAIPQLRHASSQYYGNDHSLARFRSLDDRIEDGHDDTIYLEHEVNTQRAKFAKLEPGDSVDYGHANYTFVKPATGRYEDMSQSLTPPLCVVDGAPIYTSALHRSDKKLDLKLFLMKPNQVAALDAEQRNMVREISKIRMAAKMHNMKENGELFRRAQNYARFLDDSVYAGLSKATELEPDVLPKHYASMRLISGPKLDAETCTRRWANGKNARHAFAIPANDVHGADCACREVVAYHAVIDRQWLWIGISHCKDGRWVVELAGMPSSEKQAYGPETRLTKNGIVIPPHRVSSKAQIRVGYGHILPRRPPLANIREETSSSDSDSNHDSFYSEDLTDRHGLSMSRPSPQHANTDSTFGTCLTFDYTLQAPEPLVLKKPAVGRRLARPDVKHRKTYQSSVYSREVWEDDEHEARDEWKKFGLTCVSEINESTRAHTPTLAALESKHESEIGHQSNVYSVQAHPVEDDAMNELREILEGK